jgi:hypothetical protein
LTGSPDIPGTRLRQDPPTPNLSPAFTSILEESPWPTNLHPVNWLVNMQAWQVLPPEQRQAQAWTQVPASVAASMAFEGEPVSRERLEELHRTATPIAASR